MFGFSLAISIFNTSYSRRESNCRVVPWQTAALLQLTVFCSTTSCKLFKFFGSKVDSAFVSVGM